MPHRRSLPPPASTGCSVSGFGQSPLLKASTPFRAVLQFMLSRCSPSKQLPPQQTPQEGPLPSWNRHSAQAAAPCEKEEVRELGTAEGGSEPASASVQRAWCPVKGQRALPAHGFTSRNAELRMQGHPSEDTDVLSKAHPSLPARLGHRRSNTAYGPVPPRTCAGTTPIFQSALHTRSYPFHLHLLLSFSAIPLSLSLFGLPFSLACPRYANTTFLIFRSD